MNIFENIKKSRTGLILTLTILSLSQSADAGSGTEGASFLDIPVGARPAAMGAAYNALANDVYAPTLNPGGLGFLESTQFAGQHVSYLDSMHYEYLSFAMPLKRGECASELDGCNRSALGGSVQYLGSGDIDGMDESGNPTGDFSSYYASYNVAYGRTLSKKLSLGLTGKMIRARIDDVSANAYAADLGGLYKMSTKLTLAASLTNLGSKLKFLSEGDSLPAALHLGAAYRATSRWLITTEGVYRKTGLASFHLGGEWRPLDLLAVRAGYRTDTLRELSPLAGFSMGMGVQLWGQELAYAWLPYGDLGNTHYISLHAKFGEDDRSKRNLIQYQHIRKNRNVNRPVGDQENPDYQQLMQLLGETDERTAQVFNGAEIQ